MRIEQLPFSIANKERGIVLISVLWLLLLLSAIVLTLVRESRLATRSTAVYLSEMQARAEIQGAVYEAIYRLVSGETSSAVVAGLQSQDFAANISNERLKLDLNNAGVEEMEGYFASHGLNSAKTLAMRVVDFRDKDDDAREGGSERRVYQTAGVANPPGNRPYLHIVMIDGCYKRIIFPKIAVEFNFLSQCSPSLKEKGLVQNPKAAAKVRIERI